MGKPRRSDYPPNNTRPNGYHRNCVIVEILSDQKLSNAEYSMICEQIEAKIDNLDMHKVRNVDVVLPHRFDQALKDSLKLK